MATACDSIHWHRHKFPAIEPSQTLVDPTVTKLIFMSSIYAWFCCSEVDWCHCHRHCLFLAWNGVPNACHINQGRHLCSMDMIRRYGSAFKNDSRKKKAGKSTTMLDARVGCRLDRDKQKPRHTMLFSCPDGSSFQYMFIIFMWTLVSATSFSFGDRAVPRAIRFSIANFRTKDDVNIAT
jgi:hypothetical protein